MSTQASQPSNNMKLSFFLPMFLIALGAFLIGQLSIADKTKMHAANISDLAGSETNAHIYFLLDRSASMSSMAGDVIQGFNAFVKEQQAEATDSAKLVMTLVQFDSVDPSKVVFSAKDISTVPTLDSTTFQPRGRTPLFDALGRAIRFASAAQSTDERIVMVVFSDGQENASREYSRNYIFDIIERKRNAGWAFVFLGANQDSYSEAGSLGYGSSNVQNFHPDKQGCSSAYSSMSGALSSMRKKLFTYSKKGVRPEGFTEYDNEDFFEGVKSAEEDYSSRSVGKFR
jgi:uncharacterized protein YegL